MSLSPAASLEISRWRDDNGNDGKDEQPYKTLDRGRHSSPALSPLPHGKHFSLFHFSRIPQDE